MTIPTEAAVSQNLDKTSAIGGDCATRRDFVGHLAKAGAIAAGIASPLVGVHASGEEAPSTSPSETIRFALVGAGGRGGGAVVDSLTINENIVLSAIADFDDKKPGQLRDRLLRSPHAASINVPDDKLLTGLDAYRRVLDDPSIDLVFFATPPGFRPSHLLDAVDAKKHIFAEKPVCVDAAGYHRCLKADQRAIEQEISLVTGTQYRRQTNYVEAMRRIHAGEIGDVIGATSRYCSAGIWYRPRPAGMSDTQYQIYNWMHFVWLSGDQICEQAIHNIDVMNWLMQSPPIEAFGGGGRFTRPDDSEMWDSMAIDYLYPGNRFISFMCRQIPGSSTETGTVVYGSGGRAEIVGSNGGSKIYYPDGSVDWFAPGDIGRAYQQEHKDLVDSIRTGQPIVELAQTAASSLTAVMGRMAAYTGKRVSWDFISETSELDLFPAEIDLSADRPSEVAVPGRNELA